MTERLQRALLELLTEHEADGALPTNGRFRFYELEQRGLVLKEKPKGTTPGTAADLIDALTKLRERELVPWDWIVDETRFVDNYTGYIDLGTGLAAQLEYLSLDPWIGGFSFNRSREPVSRWLLAQSCRRAPGPAGGDQAHGFFHTKVKPHLRESMPGGRPPGPAETHRRRRRQRRGVISKTLTLESGCATGAGCPPAGRQVLAARSKRKFQSFTACAILTAGCPPR